jgi:hypothetical protein
VAPSSLWGIQFPQYTRFPLTGRFCPGPAPRFFSTIIHSFPQLFCVNPLDAKIRKFYLPRQIEPEGEDLSVRFRVREFLTVFAVPNLAGG